MYESYLVTWAFDDSLGTVLSSLPSAWRIVPAAPWQLVAAVGNHSKCFFMSFDVVSDVADCCAKAQCESLRFKLIGGLAVRRACYGVLRLGFQVGFNMVQGK